MAASEPEAHNIAVFIDLENVAIGTLQAKLRAFDVGLVLNRLVDKGKIVVRKAYADWGKYEEYKRPLHEAGVELIELPGSKLTGKNSADIKMVVDSLELAFSKAHIDTFALVTGDSDFYPLVAKLRENNKRTLAVGVKDSTSSLLIDACDEFIFYDDLVRRPRRRQRSKVSKLPEKKRDAFVLLVDAALALLRENRQLHSSLVKETMKRKQPQFNEEYHGYRSFSRLLEDAEKNKIISLHRDERSGTYVIDDIMDDAL